LNSYFNLTNSVGKDIADRLTQPHNYVCIIFLASLIIIVFIRYTFLQIILFTCCKNCTESEVDHLSPIEIVTGSCKFNLALPVKKIHHIHKLRKLQLKKIKDIVDKKELSKYYTEVMSYEQAAMKDKIMNGSDHKHPELEQDFEGNIDKVIKEEKFKEKVIIEDDYSYNFSVKRS
jgi:hypothetical protein